MRARNVVVVSKLQERAQSPRCGRRTKPALSRQISFLLQICNKQVLAARASRPSDKGYREQSSSASRKPLRLVWAHFHHFVGSFEDVREQFGPP
jgi:hypothetical protein